MPRPVRAGGRALRHGSPGPHFLSRSLRLNEPLVILAIVGVVLALAIGVLVWWFRREHHRRLPAVSTPPIVFVPHSERADHWAASQPDVESMAAAARPQFVESEAEVPVRRVAGLADGPTPTRRRPRGVPMTGAEVTPAMSAPAMTAAAPAAPPAPAPGVRPLPAAPGTLQAGAAYAPMIERIPGDGAGTADRRANPFAPPAVGPAVGPIIAGSTLRMLPGRLEFVGDGTAADIRFVHCTAGPEQRVTLGRGEGPSYEHVQLRSPTVSRMHAAMVYRDGRWTIANLSDTNPLRLNGLELASDSAAVPLSDGDVIELGEVMLRFHG